jgi:hypothetical protein
MSIPKKPHAQATDDQPPDLPAAASFPTLIDIEPSDLTLTLTRKPTPLDGTAMAPMPTVTTATLTAQLIDTRVKMTATMNNSLLETRRALKVLIVNIPVGSTNPRTAIAAQLESLNAKLENVSSTATSTLVSIVDLQNTVLHLSWAFGTMLSHYNRNLALWNTRSMNDSRT